MRCLESGVRLVEGPAGLFEHLKARDVHSARFKSGQRDIAKALKSEINKESRLAFENVIIIKVLYKAPNLVRRDYSKRIHARTHRHRTHGYTEKYTKLNLDTT